jgi:dihydrofolate reductase
MRKLVLKMSISVDGFVGGPNGEIDWIFRNSDEEGTKWTVENISSVGAHLMGSRTYHDMAAYWPTSTEAFAPPMNEIPKIVFSRRGIARPSAASTTTALKNARAQYEGGPPQARPSQAVEDSWLRPTVLTGDLADEIARLKAQPGRDLLAHGGASFAQSLVQLGLVDEFRLLVHPVALGRGLPLFGTLAKPLDLRLVSTKRFAGGTMAHVYQLKA